MGDRGDLRLVGDGQRPSHRMSVRVLDDDQPADRLMWIRGVAEGFPDLVRVHRAVGPLVQCPDRGPDDHGVAGGLIENDMALIAGDGFLAACEMGHLGNEVAHRPGRDEQAGFLAEQPRSPFLECPDRGIVAEDIVPDLGVGHGAAHLGCWARYGVGAKIDHIHGRRQDTAHVRNEPGAEC